MGIGPGQFGPALIRWPLDNRMVIHFSKQGMMSPRPQDGSQSHGDCWRV